MKIVGLKRLDSNFYQKIIIYDDMITVLGIDSNLTNVNELRVPRVFSSELEGLTDDEIIDKVVAYYLNYNKIIALSAKQDESFVGALSECGKILEFRGENSKRLLKKITDRYYQDREEFFLNLDDYQHVQLDTSLEDAAYSVVDDSLGKVLKVCLMLKHTKDGYLVLDSEDILFSRKVINATMQDNIAESCVSEDHTGVDYLEKTGIISNSDGYPKRNIYVSEMLMPLTDFIVDNHNSEVFLNRYNEKCEGEKVLQMEMEEFKWKN